MRTCCVICGHRVDGLSKCVECGADVQPASFVACNVKHNHGCICGRIVAEQRERAEQAEAREARLREAATEKLAHDKSEHHGGRCQRCFDVDDAMAAALAEPTAAPALQPPDSAPSTPTPTGSQPPAETPPL